MSGASVDVRKTMLIREPRSGLCGQGKSMPHDGPHREGWVEGVKRASGGLVMVWWSRLLLTVTSRESDYVKVWGRHLR